MRLTAGQLNRATLDRQLLLRREPMGVVDAVHRVVGLQAQEAASPYLALWNRLAAFDPADLDAAFEDRVVVKASLMRITLHAVRVEDYPAFHNAVLFALRASRLNDRRFISTGLSTPDADALVPHVLAFAAQARTGAEIETLLDRRLDGVPTRWVWWALRTFAPLVHAPTGGPWSFGSRPSYVAAPIQPSSVGHDESAARLVRRYLEGFGPATAADIATFTFLRHLSQAADGSGRPACPDRRAGAARGAGRRRALRRAGRAAPGRGHAGAAEADGHVGQRPARIRRPRPRDPAGLPQTGEPDQRGRPGDPARGRPRRRSVAAGRRGHRGDGVPPALRRGMGWARDRSPRAAGVPGRSRSQRLPPLCTLVDQVAVRRDPRTSRLAVAMTA